MNYQYLKVKEYDALLRHVFLEGEVILYHPKGLKVKIDSVKRVVK